jgi:Zn-dependent M28 family amino/carboxypeptidase
VALWTGEEQGIFGSSAYVKQHFGYEPEQPRRTADERRADAPTTQPADDNAPEGGRNNPATQPAGPRRPRNIIKGADYEKLSVYFNLDNGTGKIRGIYAQSNEAAVPIFTKWLQPFHDLGAKTVTISNTGSTDHVSFDQIGLPGFQYIQDSIEYGSRTHHSNEDVYDRAQAGDLKQASTIMAAFLWNAANMDERFPRKPIESAPTTQPTNAPTTRPANRVASNDR